MSFNPQSYVGSAAACEAGHTFEPSDPFGQPIGATVTVRGPESEIVRQHLQERRDADHAAELAAAKRGRPMANYTIEQLEDRAVHLAVAYTIRWTDFVGDDGQPLAPTRENMLATYRRHSWLRAQVLAEAGELGNFIRCSSASSSSTSAPNTGSV